MNDEVCAICASVLITGFHPRLKFFLLLRSLRWLFVENLNLKGEKLKPITLKVSQLRVYTSDRSGNGSVIPPRLICSNSYKIREQNSPNVSPSTGLGGTRVKQNSWKPLQGELKFTGIIKIPKLQIRFFFFKAFPALCFEHFFCRWITRGSTNERHVSAAAAGPVTSTQRQPWHDIHNRCRVLWPLSVCEWEAFISTMSNRSQRKEKHFFLSPSFVLADNAALTSSSGCLRRIHKTKRQENIPKLPNLGHFFILKGDFIIFFPFAYSN